MNVKDIIYDMTLLRERRAWRDLMERGQWDESPLLTLYKKHRDDGTWRSTRVVEQLLEYILFLESQIKDK